MNNTYHPLVLLAGRVLIASVYLVAGVRKLMGFAGTVGYFTKLGFPAPEFVTVLAIIIEIGGGLLLVFGWKTRWAAWLIALFTLIAAFAAHRFWEIGPRPVRKPDEPLPEEHGDHRRADLRRHLRPWPRLR